MLLFSLGTITDPPNLYNHPNMDKLLMRIGCQKIEIILLLLSILVVTTNAQEPLFNTPADFHEHEWQRIAQRFQHLELLQPTRSQANMDVTYYRLALDTINTTTETIYGNVTITAKSLVDNYLNTDINFSQPMTVDSVIMPGQIYSWNHLNDLIQINWNTPIDSGQTFSITIYYHGHPLSSGFGSFQWGTHNSSPIVGTLSEPEGAREWWPCKDIPNDKAGSIDVLIRTRDDFISTSNGLLQDVISHGDGTNTHHWHHNYPISTYLVSITSTNYQILTDEYVTLSGDTMPITHYVYPEDYNDAVIDFDITVPAIQALRQYFNEYPFTDESYGMAEFNWGGAMEHQTLTSYGRPLIRGDHYYDWILVHELGHQWWGDAVTLDDWPHIWLNEGFATYSEALWQDHINGIADYHNYMRNRLFVNDPSGPIYDPSYLFSSNTVYHKGAWVLHMLRGVVGDSIWSIFPEYYNRFQYRNATTEELQEVCEDIWGDSLGWFFQEWIYGVNRPDYKWSWDVGSWGGNYHIFVDITQQQTNAGLFTMPIQCHITGAATDTTLILWDSLETQSFTADLPWNPIDAELDPDQWILRWVTEVPYPLTIVTDSVLTGLTNEPYADTLHGIGGTEPYLWELSAGTLPEGLVLDSLSGVISGVPLQSGSSQFTISLTDDLGSLDFREISLMILGAPNAIDDLIIMRNRNNIFLTWNPVPTATGYTIYRSNASTTLFDSIATVTITNYIDPDIIASRSNCLYQVTARRD